MPSERAHLSPAELDELRQLVGTKIAEVERSLAASTGDAKPVDLGLSIGRLSRVDALQQQHMAAARRERCALVLQQLRSAAHRFDTGAYGLCLECGESIGLARLRARPETTWCRECQHQDT